MARRKRSFRLGDRTELLAEMCLNTLAFTTKVPRQEDVGHDFICFLSHLEDDLFYAGKTFTVQVKSNKRKIVYKTAKHAEWLRSLENPYYILVGNKKKMQFELFSTWRVLEEVLMKQKASKITLYLKERGDGQHPAFTEPKHPGGGDDYEQHVYLGKQIISISAESLMDEENTKSCRELLSKWVSHDKKNITSSDSGICWIETLEHHEPNIFPNTKSLKYYYGSDLDVKVKNFSRICSTLVMTINNMVGNGENAEHLKQMAGDLAEVMLKHSSELESAPVQVLQNFLEQQKSGGE